MFNGAYHGKRVLLTGHTGFKGSWLAIWLTMLGAEVVGFSLDPYTEKDNFNVSHLSTKLFADIRGDIRDYQHLDQVVKDHQPEVVFHLAAQALVKAGYDAPRETYETNVMGSLHVLDAVRRSEAIKSVVMVTSDKCYKNLEQIWGYKETDRMGGYDPYSSSKGCAELLISSYRNSYFHPNDYNTHKKGVASVRAGNVIGGGDWSENRLIPDCIRAIEAGKSIELRSPQATRPWEHVLESLSGYLRVGEKLMQDPVRFATGFNFGPHNLNNKTVMEVVTDLIEHYGKGQVVDVSNPNDVHEHKLLKLDVTKAYEMLNWEARWDFDTTLEKTVNWYKEALTQADMYAYCQKQIQEYVKLMPNK